MADANFDFPLTLIGAGCICSNAVLFLARMGLRNIKVFDGDLVEEHNLSNQVYRTKDIGRLKVDALREIVAEMTGVQIETEARRIEQEYLESVVICGVDSMSTRKAIWEKSVKYQPQIKLYLETRVGGSALKVYTLDPTDIESIRFYEANLHSDSAPPGCVRGEIPTLAAVVAVICGAIKNFARKVVIPKEVIIDVDNWRVVAS